MQLKITPLSATLGARVEGLDIDGLDKTSHKTLRKAFHEHQVLFFPGLDPTPPQHKDLAQVFGQPERHGDDKEDQREAFYADEEKLISIIDSKRNPANFWHTDATFRERPPGASCLHVKVLPERGGDTLWLDTYRAYEELAPPLQALARSLRAIHGHRGVTNTHVHPVVRTHPETGKQALWINRGWTTGLEDVGFKQAKALLEFFFDVMEQPEYMCRWSWSLGDVAIWDNRCTMHYALLDFGDAYREIHRIIVAGEVPC
jgi:taurine dioxygenase